MRSLTKLRRRYDRLRKFDHRMTRLTNGNSVYLTARGRAYAALRDERRRRDRAAVLVAIQAIVYGAPHE